MGELITAGTLLLFIPCPEGEIVQVFELIDATLSTKSILAVALFTVVLTGGLISTVLFALYLTTSETSSPPFNPAPAILIFGCISTRVVELSL